jgi:predicted amidohydrolase
MTKARRTILEHHNNPPQYETETLAALSYARAFETETVWILCNAGGPAKDGYIGGSGIWMPLKGKVGGCKTVDVELAIVDVDMEVLKVSHLQSRKLME